MKFLGLLMLVVLALYQDQCACCGARTAPIAPSPAAGGGSANCCTTQTSFGPITIAASADQVPVELQRCGAHGDEISAIVVSGKLSGCANVTSDIVFSTLTVDFTTDRSRCVGTGTHRATVELTNVHYTGNLRLFVTPRCVADSWVDPFGFSTADPGFNTLFLTNGRGTVGPILDSLVLRWAISSPPTCPPSVVFGTSLGNRARCP